MTPARFDEMQAQLGAAIGAVMRLSVVHGMPVLDVERASVLPVAQRLKSSLGFDLLVDITAVDWPLRTPRLDVVYHFYSTRFHDRVRVKAGVAVEDPAVDSLISLYGSANFMERECHDMYGIVFNGNADLRPILLYEGFVGHPLRKDYDKHAEQPLVPYRT